jgi:hypothetical protein
MTAISNVFCADFIAFGSDSFLTKKVGNKIEYVETDRSKIFALNGLRGGISYWGFAGLERLSVADELKALADQAHNCGTLEAFAQNLRVQCNNLLRKYTNIPKGQRGLGIHVAGYEEMKGVKIPELFLVTNFTDLAYNVGDQLGCSRRTNVTITGDSGDDAYLQRHAEFRYRKQVHDHLQSGNVLFFNNGDPQLFTIAANGILESMRALSARAALKAGNDAWRDLAIRPIEIIADLQKSFAKDMHRIVGGRIHDLVVYPNGTTRSDSGVVPQRWSDR